MTGLQFADMVRGEQEEVRRFLLALCCGDRDEADDIAQEAFVKAYLSWGAYTENGRVKAWLFRIAYNVFIDRQRRGCRNVGLDEAVGMADPVQADSSFVYQDLYAALDELPPKERTSVLLYYLEGFSVREIAEMVDSKENAVKKQLSRAREHLKTRLER